MKEVLLSLTMVLLALSSFAQLNMQLRSTVQYSVQCSDVWGYYDENSKIEYAIVGKQDGVSIVSLEDVDNAKEIVFIPGAPSGWRDIKTWGHHAYVTNESNNGLMVIDLSKLPDEAPHFDWAPYIEGLQDTLKECHNLYIDERGVCYLSGCNLNDGGLIFVDVATNPEEPKLIGWNDSYYSHDVFVRDGKIYDSQFYKGDMVIFDHTDLEEAIELARQPTPFNRTHNIWLSDDSKVAFTTDEFGNAPVAAYDISDLDDIILLDEFRPIATLGENVVPHNVHVWEDWLLISYYSDGGIVVDASRPENLIEVGNFDTYLGNETGFNGAWGLYPYLPSGTVLVSDKANGLFVLTPNLVHACWLEGNVTELDTGIPLGQVSVEITAPQANRETSNSFGEYSTGLAASGTYDVTFSKPGYFPKTVTVSLENGVVTIEDVQLENLPNIQFSGIVTNAENGEPIASAEIQLTGIDFEYIDSTDENGNFLIEGITDQYQIYIGKWGFKYEWIINPDGNAPPLEIELTPGYQDDFIFDFNWTTRADTSVTEGFWERGKPLGNILNQFTTRLDFDLNSDLGELCYVTHNLSGNTWNGDVDNGSVFLTSPPMDLTTYNSPIIDFHYFFYSVKDLFAISNDSMRIYLNNGIDEKVFTINQNTLGWEREEIIVEDYLQLTENMTFGIEVFDIAPNHVVEAALDGFEVVEGNPSSIDNLSKNILLEAFPNPFDASVNFKYQIENPGATLLITNLLGQQVESHRLSGTTGNIQLGDNWITGIYFAKIAQDGKQSKVLKIFKQ